MDPNQTLDHAISLSQDLLHYANQRGWSARDLLLISSMSKRLLHETLTPAGEDVLQIALEADAVYEALSTQLESN